MPNSITYAGNPSSGTGKSKSNHRGGAPISPFGATLHQRELNPLDTALNKRSVEQNKNIVLICKIFTQRGFNGLIVGGAPGSDAPANFVSPGAPNIQRPKVNVESRRPPSGASNDNFVMSKKYDLLQSLLGPKARQGANWTLQQPFNPLYSNLTYRRNMMALTESKTNLGNGLRNLWGPSYPGAQTNTFKHLPFLTYWLLPFISLVPLVTSNSREFYGAESLATPGQTGLSQEGPEMLRSQLSGSAPSNLGSFKQLGGAAPGNTTVVDTVAGESKAQSSIELSANNKVTLGLTVEQGLLIKSYVKSILFTYRGLTGGLSGATPPAHGSQHPAHKSLNSQANIGYQGLRPRAENSQPELSSQGSIGRYAPGTTSGIENQCLAGPEALNLQNQVGNLKKLDLTFNILTASGGPRAEGPLDSKINLELGTQRTMLSGQSLRKNFNFAPLKTLDTAATTIVHRTETSSWNSVIGVGRFAPSGYAPGNEPSVKTKRNISEELRAPYYSNQKPLFTFSEDSASSSPNRSSPWANTFVVTYHNYLKYIRQKLSFVGVGLLRPHRPTAHIKYNLNKVNTNRDNILQGTKLGLKNVWSLNPTEPNLKHNTGGQRANSRAKSIHLVLNQKKFYFISDLPAFSVGAEPLRLKTGLAPKGPKTTSVPGQRNTLEGTADPTLVYFNQKKEIEKKRKAKKLRLESRRQKKRKRFYPRPTWLRLRLKFDSRVQGVSGTRLLSNDRYALGWVSDPQKTKSLLNTFQQAEMKETKWNKALTLTTYNKFLYNLAFSIKDPQTSLQSSNSNPHISTDLEPPNTISTGVLGKPPVQKRVGRAEGPTSGDKKQNQEVAEFLYAKKMELTRKNLGQIKSKANYVNFEPKSANQTLPKKETNSSLYRDFWLWLYNTTSTNTYNKTLLLDNFLNHMSIPLNLSAPATAGSGKNLSSKFNLWLSAQVSNETALTVVPWAINKTNLHTGRSPKRLNLWSNQKLRNQSKNNKTKWIQKQIQTKVNNLLSSATKVADLTLKLDPTQVDSSTLKKSLILKIRQKIHQKEQKLAYLVNNPYSKKSLNNGAPTTLGQQAQTEITPLNRNQIESLNSKASANLAWWESLSAKTTAKLGSLNQMQTVNLFHKSFEPVVFNQADYHKTLNQASVWIGLLVHFCALISLLSISQIRCFIKFHFILIHKLSNAYLTILYKVSSALAKNISQVAPNALFGGRRSLNTNKNSTLWPFSLEGAGGVAPEKRLSDAKQGALQKSKSWSSLLKTQNQLGLIESSRHMVSSFWSASSPRTFLKPKQITSINLRDVYGSRDAGQALSNGSTGSSLLNSSNLRILFEKQTIIRLAQISRGNQPSRNLSKNSSLLDARRRGGEGNKLPGAPRSSVPSNTPEALSNKSYNKWQRLSQSYKLLYPKLTLTGPKAQSYQNLLKQAVKTQSLTKQLAVKELLQYVNKTTKKAALNTGFKMVDSFESCLRLIYGFFEKPAEFTMDWIAYAFLVEWSSDLLAFTPQKTETQNWLSFSKVIRQNQIGFSLYRPVVSGNLALVLPMFLFTQFLSKRFLYLNDLFLGVLYKPDTDLLTRQKKGTLFWDIWSDFLIKAADKYNINVPSLSNIKDEQNLLLDNFLSDNSFMSDRRPLTSSPAKQNLAPQLSAEDKALKRSEELPWGPMKAGALIAQSLNVIGKNTNPAEQVGRRGLRPRQVPSSLKTAGNKSSLDANVLALYSYAQSNKHGGLPETSHINLSLVSAVNGTPNLLDLTNVAQQFITYQAKETELFLDYNTPKSFNSLSSIKYYSLLQQPLGTLVCQIYSGLLTQQIAKNILVIGSTLSSNSSSGRLNLTFENNQKTLLIQALAGETEIKIITDNASRYAIVNRGFAVGIKYLKEVFDAITLNTPCLFLLEDIHLIGERRPQLISDHGDAIGSADGMNKSIDAAFGSQRSGDAVHEKNQIYYQLSRHAITHYRKPFKGDFSLAIPTNHFSFDLFLKSRSNNFVNNSNSSFFTHPLSYGINIFEPDQNSSTSGPLSEKATRTTNLNTKLTSKRSLTVNTSSSGAHEKLSTSQLVKLNNNTLLAPPSTSPFSVLLLKEQKKLKATKVVKEIPWVGLPTEQLSLLPRVSYSVRAKVSALAELGFTNMSAKLDMITDLLVIIDSVRSHRGFVVFATTHLPHLLDPALRRPGRLDETISIPTMTNLWTRWEFSKSALNLTYLNSVGWGKQSTIGLNQTNNYLTNSLTGSVGTYNMTDFFTLDFATNLNHNLFSPIVHGFNKLTTVGPMKTNLSLLELEKRVSGASAKLGLQGSDFDGPKLSKQYLTKVTHIAYYQMGKKLIACPEKASGQSAQVFKISNLNPTYLNPTTSNSTTSLNELNEMILNYGPEALKYKSLYSSSRNIQNILIGLMGGKFTEIFAFKTFAIPKTSGNYPPNAGGALSTLELDASSKLTLRSRENGLLASPMVSLVSGTAGILNSSETRHKLQQNFMSLYGLDETWRAATSFALSFVQKRYLFNKNLIVPKLLNIGNFSPLEEAPSPPSSNILIPAKRYENYKKSLKENVKVKLLGLTSSNLQSKLQNHQKQAFIRNIYAPATKGPEEYLKTANNSLLKLAAADLNKTLFIQSTNANAVYENKIYYRHRLALNNQWWNAQLTEHSAETLFLSDIDWRYMSFNTLKSETTTNLKNTGSKNLGPSGALTKLKESQNKFLNNLISNYKGPMPLAESGTVQNSRQDLLIDFPDADQMYNPKQRRWVLTSGYWASWFNLDKNLQNQQIFDSLMFESVMSIYEILNNNREVLDYSATKFIKKGLVK